jgi:transcriptional regulator with XRE-family HTH domain
MISGTQVRAARALLDWSVRDLARRAVVSIATVHLIEEATGLPSTIRQQLDAVQAILEGEGIEFLGRGAAAPEAKEADAVTCWLSNEARMNWRSLGVACIMLLSVLSNASCSSTRLVPTEQTQPLFNYQAEELYITSSATVQPPKFPRIEYVFDLVQS